MWKLGLGLLLLATLGDAADMLSSTCMDVDGETVCYDLYDAGDGNEISYDNTLCQTLENPEGSFATVENEQVMQLVDTLTGLMVSDTDMWIAGKHHIDDIYFRTVSGRIIPMHAWPNNKYVYLDDNDCASVGDDGVWDPLDCDSGTARYYLCQNKTDTCPVKDICDRQTPCERNLEEWCFWPYDFRFADDYELYGDEAGFAHCNMLGGHVMSMHNLEEWGKVNDIVNSFYVQDAYGIFNEGFAFHLTMVNYNYRWRNGCAAVGLRNLDMDYDEAIYIDRPEGFEHFLQMEMTGSDPLEIDYIEWETNDDGSYICEAKRVDLCLFHAFKAPHALVASNLTHLLYTCEKGHQFPDGNTTKMFECSCNFDKVQEDTCDIGCEPTPFCENLAVGEKCECEPGYQWDESCLECEDIDECAEKKACCDQICINTDGSYECDCFEGFELHPNATNTTAMCLDIDECVEDEPCPDESFCVNTYGSFNCVCQRGFAMNLTTSTCYDINECDTTADLCGDNGRCINCVGFYLCECDPGYRLSQDHGCEDVDECNEVPPRCSHNCTNTDGSFECYCPDGFELDPIFGTKCIDIDECHTNNGGCLVNQRCENTVGSFQCHCHEGFRWDVSGLTCIDVDECAENLDTCSNEEQCDNLMGSFICYCGEDQLRRSNGECVYPYSATDMVCDFRMGCPFRQEYGDKGSPEFKDISRAVEQQYFLSAKQRLLESSFRLDLSSGGSDDTVAEATVGIPYVPDLVLTRDVMLAVYRAMRTNNLVLYLGGQQTCPLTRQVSCRTSHHSVIWDFSDVCVIYNSLDYCTNGQCEAVDGQDQPRCRCEQRFAGERCDMEMASMWNPLTISLLSLAGLLLLLLPLCCCFLLWPRGGGARFPRPRRVVYPPKPQWPAMRAPLRIAPGPFPLRSRGGAWRSPFTG